MTLNIYDPTYGPEIKRAIDSLKKILDTCDSTNSELELDDIKKG